MNIVLKRMFFVLLIPFYLMGQNTNVSKVATTSAAFLEIPVGAVAVGMGGAFVGVANDASAIYWNVAGISRIGKYDLHLSSMAWIGNTRFNFVGLVLPIGESGALGFSFSGLSMADMAVRTVEKPEGTGEFFSAGAVSFGISYARNLTDRFSIGLTFKSIQENIWHMTAQGFAVDAGTYFKTDLFGGMVIGASISNFGSALKLKGRDTRSFIRIDQTKKGSNDRIPTNIELDSWGLPLTFRLGLSTVAIKNDIYKLKVNIDAIHPNNDYESINIGGELSFLDIFSLRGGYNALFLKDREGGLSLGVGVNSTLLFSNTKFQFDYAYRNFGRLRNVHMFSLEFKF